MQPVLRSDPPTHLVGQHSSSMATLPLDILLNVALYLDTEDLINACPVSKAWYSIISSNPRLWQHPRFHIASNRNWDGIICKPDPNAVLSRLQGEYIYSMHLSGPPTGYNFHYMGSWFFPAGTASVSLVQRFLSTMPIQPKARYFHLLLDKFETGEKEREALLKDIIPQLPPTRLSVGALPRFDELARVAHYLFTRNACDLQPWVAKLQAMDLMCSPHSVTAFPALPPASQPGWHPLAHPARAPPEQMVSITYVIPESLYSGWKTWTLPVLQLHPFVHCHVVGGAWYTPHENNYTTQHLVLSDIWKVQRSRSEPVFLGLKTLDISFQASGVRWSGSIIRLLSATLHEGLEAVRVRFPGNAYIWQQDILNKIWRAYLIAAHSLQILELDNYIPSALTAFCEDGRVHRNMQRPVLSNGVLPRNFATLFMPESLPNLEYLDLSKAYWHVDALLQEQQEWTDKWEKVKISAFMPPRVNTA